ncbi:MAG: hypothetical protein A3H29_10690 [Acidobacteria bacterium RIFCSPLOWO2_02_FULL_67_21]|nr:MAG: hypothetical protein A3H29_10690 [Acidobacteria bacterium RIFCSPLOWO2_02_FULL_67_21]
MVASLALLLVSIVTAATSIIATANIGPAATGVAVDPIAHRAALQSMRRMTVCGWQTMGAARCRSWMARLTS